ncbi:MAG: acyl-CoA thioesterase [Pseudomonadales bacterium]
MTPKHQSTPKPSTAPRNGAERAAELLSILALEPIEQNLFRGRNETRDYHRLFGGQVLSQALSAAYATADGGTVHSLHGYFLRAGSHRLPVLYEVDRIRDGRSFATRRVVGIQSGQAIFSMSVSLHKQEVGFDHALPMPNVPPPEELEDDEVVAARLPPDAPGLSPMARIQRPFYMRSVFAADATDFAADRRFNPVWIKFRDAVADDVALHHCLLAYASDMGLVSTGTLPHQSSIDRRSLQMASLDHGLWIHRAVRVDDWLLFHKHTTTAAGARGLSHGEFFSRDGLLVASVTQEGLLRPARKA